MSPALLGALAALTVVLLPGSFAGRRPLRRSVARDHRSWRATPAARAGAAVALGALAALVVGGTTGPVIGVVAATATAVVLARFEPASQRRRRDEVERSAPLALDLVAACLASGATVDASVAAAATAVGGPAGDLLREAVSAARLGAPAATAWRGVAAEPALAGFARAVVRAHDTGAALGDVLPRLASQARASRRAAAEARVRTAAVRLTAPLGLAFLPAFVLLGVVPVVASWVGALL